jgi:4-hydroxymandelate synthase
MTTNFPGGPIAYVELYVRDAVRALEFFAGAFAFTALALAELPDRYCVLLASGSVRVIITEPRGGSVVADWLGAHGDGVRDVALYRSDLGDVTERARQAGLPVLVSSGDDAATIGGFGSVQHTLLRNQNDAALPPGFEWQPLRSTTPEQGLPVLDLIDHLAVCLPAGTLEPTVATYQFVFDMQILSSERVLIGDTAMNSHVLRDDAGLTYVMVESDIAHGPGLVDQFLDTHHGAGVQHLAFRTDDIVAAVREYTARGVGFVPAPPATYYQALAQRVVDVPELRSKLADLEDTGVLLDRDRDGVLYQIFTTSPHEREALCYELLERQGSIGFCTNNMIAVSAAHESDLIGRSIAGRAGGR